MDVIKGAGCALDPNPAPAARRWHGTAMQAFDETFKVLTMSRELALQKIPRPQDVPLKEVPPIGQAARKTEVAQAGLAGTS
jgi:hypothetical protein